MAARTTSSEDPLGYEDLPAFLKAKYSPLEYAWLGAEGRARLLQVETENDWDEP